MGTARKTATEAATARSRVYGLLATVFRAEPDADFIRHIKSPEVLGTLLGLGVDIGSQFNETPETHLLEDLAQEFTRLFLGPGPHISPYESIHADDANPTAGQLWGKQAVEVKAFIEEAGLVYDNDFHDLPDHISAELEFMQKLAEHEAQLWQDSRDDDARQCLAIERRFFEEHLGQWVPRFCEKVVVKAEMDFYKQMAILTSRVLDYERDVLESAQTQA